MEVVSTVKASKAKEQGRTGGAIQVLCAAAVACGALAVPSTSHALTGLFRIAPQHAPHKSWDLPGVGCPYYAGNTPSSLALYTHDNTCGSGDQRWWVQDMGNGTHEIRQGGSGGKCLDIDNGGNGTGLGTYTCHGGNNQRWILTQVTPPNGGGLYGLWEIKSAYNGKVVDLSNHNTANGTQIIVWNDLDNGAQRWIFWANGGPVQDWADDFNGSSLDTGAWTALTIGAEWRNNEDQRYNPSQVNVSGGSLNITANHTCAAGQSGSNCYVSGRINSKGKRWYRNGIFSARTRYTENGGGAMGTWPAYWLLGNNSNESPANGAVGSGACWPNSGSRELDVWEWVRNNNGSGYLNNAISANAICTYPIANPADATSRYASNTWGWNWGDWIITSVRVNGDEVSFYRHGERTHTVWNGDFKNEDYAFIFNLAVGGDLGGANHDFNANYKWAKLQVDWVAHEYW